MAEETRRKKGGPVVEREKMTREERCRRILARLEAAEEPLSGALLAEELGVSRQAVVQDVEALRRSGRPVRSTPRGYRLEGGAVFSAVFAVRHGRGELLDELLSIVEAGGHVVDVQVEHPLYGSLTGSLDLRSREDVLRFVSRVEGGRAELLSALSDGVHLHRVEAPDGESLERIAAVLRGKGYLLG